MAITRTESRNRVGITWYETEAEAQEAAIKMFATYPPESIEAANAGYVQCGRDRAFDIKDDDGNTVEFAVVTP